ncbi:hypothetical protein J6590_080869 [Homalodisca vitripennis]|nr:hypothetical protein J6590_080869 [Homalodisca vitripennis]
MDHVFTKINKDMTEVECALANDRQTDTTPASSDLLIVLITLLNEVCETPEINTVTGKTRGGRMLASGVLSDYAYQEKVAIHNLLLLVLIVISAVT